MEYEVKLEIFEGPLDLLIHLIHKNEVDIFDIPISIITDQYLEYIDMMKALNVDIAGDFLVMASTLIHVKSKMLLPGLNSEEEDDPRVEITRPLLEYMKFREIAGEFSDRDLLERDVFRRELAPYFEKDLSEEELRLEVNLFQLMDAFKRIIEKNLPEPQLKMQSDKWSIKEKIEAITALVKEKGPIFFSDIFTSDRGISEMVVSFLAILELIHVGKIRVIQPNSESDIRLIPCF